MKIKRPMLFLEGDDDNASVLAGMDLDVPVIEVESGDVPEPKVDPDPQDPEKVDPAPAPAFDPAAMADIFAAGLAKAGLAPQQQQEPVAPKLTPEEAAKLLNKWTPTKEWYVKYDNLETREAAMQELLEGQTKHADTINQLRLQQLQHQFNEQLAPVQAMIQRQQAEATEKRFHATYPELAKPELAPLVDTAINALNAKGAFKPGKEKENFKLVADLIEGFMKTANPNFKLTPNGSTPPGKPTNNNGRGLKAATSGASGGGGGKPPAEAPRNKVLELLG